MAKQFSNHQDARPDVELAPGIMAVELIPPNEPAGVVMSAHKIWVPPGVDYPPHTHPAPHVIVILEGGGHGLIGDRQAWLSQGDVFYVPGNVRHVVGADSRGMVMLAISSHSLPLTHPDRLRVVE